MVRHKKLEDHWLLIFIANLLAALAFVVVVEKLFESYRKVELEVVFDEMRLLAAGLQKRIGILFIEGQPPSQPDEQFWKANDERLKLYERHRLIDRQLFVSIVEVSRPIGFNVANRAMPGDCLRVNSFCQADCELKSLRPWECTADLLVQTQVL